MENYKMTKEYKKLLAQSFTLSYLKGWLMQESKGKYNKICEENKIIANYAKLLLNILEEQIKENSIFLKIDEIDDTNG